MSGFFRTYADADAALQAPFDVAVVMPTLLRPTIAIALRSVFEQDLHGRIQVLIGIDTPTSDLALLDAMCMGRPAHCVVQVFYPGYSTSARHGGISRSRDSGALRCMLSYLANSTHVAYLDDDNWWRPDHLRRLRAAIGRCEWAFSLRWFVHPVSHRAICVDEWESVGPGRGVFQETVGGHVDPNCLMLDKLACEAALPLWNRPLPGDPFGTTADRSVFAALRQHFRGAGTGQPTAFYTLNPEDSMHPLRLRLMGAAYDEAAKT